MKTEKFLDLYIGQTFYRLGDYGRIDQYEKTSDSYAEQIMTASSRWFDDEELIYID
jgi:hypothetical protein